MALTVKNLSFSEVQRADPSDPIIVKIGDEQSGLLQANFKPLLNISRWDEVYIAIFPQLTETGAVIVAVNQTADKVTFTRNNTRINLYNISTGYEYEIVWLAKPINNTIRFLLNTNLDAFYQPPLNEEMHDASCSETLCNGIHRPVDIVGSYAFYYKNPPANIIGGKARGSGKAMHLKRIAVKDAGGKSIWADMVLVGNVLTISIDKAFLDGAVYPVTIDPTFGWGTAPTCGASYQSFGNDERTYANYTATEAGTMTKMSMCIQADGTDNTLASMGGLYDSHSRLVWHSDDTNIVVTTSATWYDWSTGTMPSLTAQGYSLSSWIRWSIPTYGGSVTFDSSGGIGGAFGGSWPTWSDPMDINDATITRKYAVYVTYTTGGGEAPVAAFSCDKAVPLAIVRNQTVTCTDSSSNTPTSWDWYGIGPNPCISANVTNQNPVIFPRNFGYCGIAMIASNGAGSSTASKGNHIYVMQPWTVW